MFVFGVSAVGVGVGDGKKSCVLLLVTWCVVCGSHDGDVAETSVLEIISVSIALVTSTDIAMLD